MHSNIHIWKLFLHPFHMNPSIKVEHSCAKFLLLINQSTDIQHLFREGTNRYIAKWLHDD